MSLRRETFQLKFVFTVNQQNSGEWQTRAVTEKDSTNCEYHNYFIHRKKSDFWCCQISVELRQLAFSLLFYENKRYESSAVSSLIIFLICWAVLNYFNLPNSFISMAVSCVDLSSLWTEHSKIFHGSLSMQLIPVTFCCIFKILMHVSVYRETTKLFRKSRLKNSVEELEGVFYVAV